MYAGGDIQLVVIEESREDDWDMLCTIPPSDKSSDWIAEMVPAASVDIVLMLVADEMILLCSLSGTFSY